MATWGNRSNRPAVCMYSHITIRRSTSSSWEQPSLCEGVLRSLSLGIMTLSRLSLTFVNSEIGSIVVPSPWSKKSSYFGLSAAELDSLVFNHTAKWLHSITPEKIDSKTKSSSEKASERVYWSSLHLFSAVVGLRWCDVVSMRSRPVRPVFTAHLHFEPDTCNHFKLTDCWVSRSISAKGMSYFSYSVDRDPRSNGGQSPFPAPSMSNGVRHQDVKTRLSFRWETLTLCRCVRSTMWIGQWVINIGVGTSEMVLNTLRIWIFRSPDCRGCMHCSISMLNAAQPNFLHQRDHWLISELSGTRQVLQWPLLHWTAAGLGSIICPAKTPAYSMRCILYPLPAVMWLALARNTGGTTGT